jgi:hypothetical protein
MSKILSYENPDRSPSKPILKGTRSGAVARQT